MKKIAILGSTGSIGTQTLDVVRANGDLEVVGISAGSNITLLEQQIREFHPKFAAVGDEAKAAELRDRVKDLPVKIGSGMDGMIELATMPESEILVTAIVGMIGIRPTVAGDEGRKRHCTGKQRDTGNGGTHYYAAGRGMRCADPSGGQRALGDFPVPARGKQKRN